MELSPASSEWRCIEVLEVWYKTSTVKAQEAASTATSSRHCETPLSRSCRCRYASGNGNVSIVSFCCCWRTFTAMLCCVSRNADDMQAKATERSRSTGGEKGRLFFLSPSWFASSVQSRVFCPCLCRAVVACVLLPSLVVAACTGTALRFSPQIFISQTCVRSGLSTRLDPCKALRRKAVPEFPTQTERGPTA